MGRFGRKCQRLSIGLDSPGTGLQIDDEPQEYRSGENLREVESRKLRKKEQCAGGIRPAPPRRKAGYGSSGRADYPSQWICTSLRQKQCVARRSSRWGSMERRFCTHEGAGAARRDGEESSGHFVAGCDVTPEWNVVREGCGTNLGGRLYRSGRFGLPPASDRRTGQTDPGTARSLVGWTPRWLGGRTAPLDLHPRCGAESEITASSGVGWRRNGSFVCKAASQHCEYVIPVNARSQHRPCEYVATRGGKAASPSVSTSFERTARPQRRSAF